MTLDLQPVETLDLQPVANSNALDLQPVISISHTDPNLVSTTADGPQLRTAGAPGAGAALLRQVGTGADDAWKTLTTTPQVVKDAVAPLQQSPAEALAADARQATLAESVSPTAAQEEQGRPRFPIPTRTRVLAGVSQGVVDTGKFFTTPLGAATLGIGALPKLAQKTIAAVFAAQMASQTPELGAAA